MLLNNKKGFKTLRDLPNFFGKREIIDNSIDYTKSNDDSMVNETARIMEFTRALQDKVEEVIVMVNEESYFKDESYLVEINEEYEKQNAFWDLIVEHVNILKSKKGFTFSKIDDMNKQMSVPKSVTPSNTKQVSSLLEHRDDVAKSLNTALKKWLKTQ